LYFSGYGGQPIPTTPSAEKQMCWTTEKRDSEIHTDSSMACFLGNINVAIRWFAVGPSP